MGLYGDHVLPRALNLIMSSDELEALRARLLSPVAGAVLEVGFGSGLNLPHYPGAVTRLHALDPSRVGLALARKRLARSPFPVELLPMRADGGIPLADGSVDAVVTTWTLCTIPDAAAALREMHRVLRSGGRYHFLEHGLSPDPAVARWQQRLDPIERALVGGCHLTRQIDAIVEASPLQLEAVANFHIKGPKFATYQYLGSAVKN